MRGARETPTWLVDTGRRRPGACRAFADCGVEVIDCARRTQGELDIDALLQALGARGLTRVLVEGGSHLAGAVLRASLVDRIVWFRAPMVIGGDGLPVAVAFGVDALAEAPRFVRRGVESAVTILSRPTYDADAEPNAPWRTRPIEIVRYDPVMASALFTTEQAKLARLLRPWLAVPPGSISAQRQFPAGGETGGRYPGARDIAGAGADCDRGLERDGWLFCGRAIRTGTID